MKTLANDCHPQSPTFAGFASLRETLRDFVAAILRWGLVEIPCHESQKMPKFKPQYKVSRSIEG